MAQNKQFKDKILKEIRKDEWKDSVDLKAFTGISITLEKQRRLNLDEITTDNERHKKIKLKRRKSLGKPPDNILDKIIDSSNVSEEAKEAYKNWKIHNLAEAQIPEVDVRNLLLLMGLLSAKEDRESVVELKECLKKQSSSFEVFWDSPCNILKALRQCVLNRDWTRMTYFLLVLLHYDKKYMHIVKNMCKIMLKYNPLIKHYDLADQFDMLLSQR